MEDGRIDMFGADKRAVSLTLSKFTLLGATTHAGLLGKPLLDRFGFVWQLVYYTVDELTEIVARSARELGVAIDDAGAAEIARRSRGIPRIANRLLRRVRDCAMVAAADGALVPRGFRGAGKVLINGPLAAMALDQFGVDVAGLDALDRAYLRELVSHVSAMGIEALAGALQQQRLTLEENVEPFLCQIGFISRTPRGRIATDAGINHVTAGVS
jgi:Holliday junction DNA helicase RuvB